MDQAMVDWAVIALDFGEDTTRAEQWFRLLTAAYQDQDETDPVGGWDEFVARLSPAAEREGIDSDQVQYFVESLRDSCSDPIGDVVLPMYEQRDTLPQAYQNLRAARAAQTGDAEYAEYAESDAGAADYDAAERPTEHEWHWDDSQQLWLHLEDNEWVPQVQNGHALNYERTEWVALEPEAAAEEPAEAESSDQAETTEANELEVPADFAAEQAWEEELSGFQAGVMENDELAAAIAELDEGELEEILESLIAEQS